MEPTFRLAWLRDRFRSTREIGLCAGFLAGFVLTGCAISRAPVRPTPSEREHAESRLAPVASPIAVREPPHEREAESPAARVHSDDDPFAGDSGFTRAALVREVQRRNPGLAAARAAVEAARARIPQESALEDPVFSYALGPQSFGSSMVNDAHMVELRQPLPIPGTLGLRAARAEAAADATGFDAETTSLGLAVLACTLYDRAYSIERELSVNETHERLLAEIHEIALARYGAGTGERDAALEVELERAELEHRRIELDAERKIVRARINALLHRAPAAALPPLPVAMPEPSETLPDEEALLDAALGARPDARAAAARITEGEHDVSLAERGFLPELALFGRWDGFWQERPLRSVVGIEIELPFAIERRRAALAEARAQLRRAHGEADRVADDTRLAVTSARLRIHEARHLVRLFDERMLPAARDRLDTARDRYSTGLADFASMLDAERALRRAELGRENALADVFRRRAELARASGDLRFIDEEASR